ncbi:hypothetical protein D9M68_495650 [compost metagenome]
MFEEEKPVTYFVKKDSVVRKIWGNSEVILFIFAGAAAEFALNKAVDWLYFTGKLPADPLKRLFSTVSYAHHIVFAPRANALKAIDSINAIHKAVEQQRGEGIPDWAYRDVLYMLIDYSIRAYELLDKPLTSAEKEEVFDVFYRMGLRMKLTQLPADYHQWEQQRKQALKENLIKSRFTNDLYQQYRKHLGALRYSLLKQVQHLLVPYEVKKLLNPGSALLAKPMIVLYKFSAYVRLKPLIKSALLPEEYKEEIAALDRQVSPP